MDVRSAVVGFLSWHVRTGPGKAAYLAFLLGGALAVVGVPEVRAAILGTHRSVPRLFAAGAAYALTAMAVCTVIDRLALRKSAEPPEPGPGERR
jgi:hypothetical protein